MTEPPPEPTVMVVDDDMGARDALSSLLRANGFPVEVFESGAAFLAAYDPTRPQCILLDLMMPGMDGFEVHQELQARDAPSPVVFVTAHGDVGRAVDAMKAGAVDFIEKPLNPEAVVDCVQRCLGAPAEQAARVAELRGRLGRLTPRECEVLEGMLDGLTNAEIAIRLGISRRTVEVYRAQVMKTMQAGTLSQLVRLVATARAI